MNEGKQSVRKWNVLRRLLEESEAREPASAEADKTRTKEEYDAFNRKLNELKFGRYAYFLNYGYVPDESPSFSVVVPPPGHFDINSRRLVLEVIGDYPLEGKDVLDVSCGRGSVAMVLRDYFRPRSYLGLDISSEAVAFCREHHQAEAFAFVEGDAESMAADSAAFDVAINVEASHTYPQVESFFREVHRVLRPEGRFLYADLGSPKSFEGAVGSLRGLGFEVTRDADITKNVLLSCEETASRRLKVYRDPEERAFMADFLAAPGSETYRAFEKGALCYRLFALQKLT